MTGEAQVTMGGPDWVLEALESRKKAPGPTCQADWCYPVGVGVHGARDHPSLPPPSTGHPQQYSLSPWRCLPSHLQSGQAASLSNIPTPLPDFPCHPPAKPCHGTGATSQLLAGPKVPTPAHQLPRKLPTSPLVSSYG